jgi:hypothetical protein
MAALVAAKPGHDGADTPAHIPRTLSPIQPMIRSAIARLFLSSISMWLLPFWPASGSSRNLALPPAVFSAFRVRNAADRLCH